MFSGGHITPLILSRRFRASNTELSEYKSVCRHHSVQQLTHSTPTYRSTMEDSVRILVHNSSRRRNGLWRWFDGRLPCYDDVECVVVTSCRNMTESRTPSNDGYITRASWRRPFTAQRARVYGWNGGRKQRRVNGKRLLTAHCSVLWGGTWPTCCKFMLIVLILVIDGGPGLATEKRSSTERNLIILMSIFTRTHATPYSRNYVIL